uniref:Uncharacterized protein n=1 Tax=Dictyoglomus turgidum TaxID=513050 RepID=A0A7C3SND7_9BACT
MIYEKEGLPNLANPELRDVFKYFLFMEIARRRFQIEFRKIMAIREGLLGIGSDKQVGITQIKELLKAIFPYIEEFEKEEREWIKRIAEEDRDKIFVIKR